MKILKRILLWSLVGVILQILGYYYLDQVYWKAETEYQEVKVNEEGNSSSEKNQVFIPRTAEEASISADGKYAAYYEDRVLKIFNTNNGQVNNITLEVEAEMSYYCWLPDRNIIVVAKKYEEEDGGKEYLNFLSYDAEKGQEIKLVDQQGNFLEIDLPSQQGEVEKIALSTLTHIMYVKVKLNEDIQRIYTINVMNQLERVRKISNRIGNICVTPHGTRLIYEDLDAEKVLVCELGPLELEGTDQLCLLAADHEDKLYLGNLANQRITKIFYGDLETPLQQWKVLDLKVTASKEDILISKNGRIYFHDSIKRKITDLLSGQSTSYPGQFLQIYDSGIISLRNNILVKTPFSAGK